MNAIKQRAVSTQTQAGKLLHGDCLVHLRTLDAGSVDLVCTDPPYGIGFMGEAWDTFQPEQLKKQRERGRRKYSPEWGEHDDMNNPAWESARYDHSIGAHRVFQEFIASTGRELLRVMKPGAFLFMSMAPRQDSLSRAIAGLEDAGFNIGFTSLYWTFASGFPKTMNIGKAVDKRLGAERAITGMRKQHDIRSGGYGSRKDTMIEVVRGGPVSREAAALDGAYAGFQPKPAVEVVIVAMKPLSEETFVDQALKNGKGITWLDDCRIGVEGGETHRGGTLGSESGIYGKAKGIEEDLTPRGRFPANLLVSDDVLNDGRERKGSSTTKVGKVYGENRGTGYLQEKAHGTNIDDSGSYSRYFSLDAWTKTLPFLIVPKASKGEKSKGLENVPYRTPAGKGNGSGRVCERCGTPQRKSKRCECPTKSWIQKTEKNHHPTVKPLRLMQYLITLGSRPGDLVLDPFLGSGTTAVAAKSLGRRFVGIEREAEYLAIARARLRTR